MTEQDNQNDEKNDEKIELSDIKLERCDISFLINVSNVKSLEEALDTAALTIGRFGLDSFYIAATDPDTNQQWVINGDAVIDAADLPSLEAVEPGPEDPQDGE